MGITFRSAAEALPSAAVTSEEVTARIAEASGLALPRGIVRRLTGIRTRRIAGDDEYASTLAMRAGALACERAGVAPSEIDLLLFASATRDCIEPATAHIVADLLGVRGQLFDVTNACNSFVNGIETARALLTSGGYRRALVVTGETPTRSIRWEVDSMAQLVDHFPGYTFGDAGAAVVLEACDGPGIGRTHAHSVSRHWEVGGIFGGGSRHPFDMDALYFRGAGTELKEAFEAEGPGVIHRALSEHGMTVADCDKVFVHQVTEPYTRRFCEVVGVAEEQLVWTVTELGNVASATMGIQLARAWDSLRSGDRCLFVGLGGGISIATMVWEVP